MVEAQAFKAVMAQFPTGVTVVTTTDGPRHYGITVSAFSSVSVDPPLVLVCLGEAARTRPIIEASKHFAVHVLSTEQVDLGLRFAGLVPEVDDPFAGLEYTTAVTGSPILPGCVAWLDCTVSAIYVAGDHSIVIGQVEAVDVDATKAPVLYQNRAWRHLA